VPDVLFLSPIAPGRGYGGAVATLTFLRALQRKGWRAHVVVGAGASAEVDDEARGACHELTLVRRAGRITTPRRIGLPCLLRHGYWPRYHPDLLEAALALLRARRFELLLLDSLGVAELGRLVRAAGIRIPTVLREHNVETALQAGRLARVQGVGARLEARARLRRYRTVETHLDRYCDLALAISAVDAEKLRALGPGVRVEPIPSPVDTGHYRPAPGVPRGKELVFVGGFDWQPNADAVRWFLQEVWASVLARHPDARLTVVGKDPPEWVRRGPHVHAPGFVPDEREIVARARAVIVPVRYGSGVRIKLINALAMGKAVVSTTAGAEGVPVRHGRSALLADAPADFAAAVSTALEDDACVERLGRAGLAVCLETFGPERIAERLDALLQGLLAGDLGRQGSPARVRAG
jgi:glycosyltransferase involved in cell wall biosynthesis